MTPLLIEALLSAANFNQPRQPLQALTAADTERAVENWRATRPGLVEMGGMLKSGHKEFNVRTAWGLYGTEGLHLGPVPPPLPAVTTRRYLADGSASWWHALPVSEQAWARRSRGRAALVLGVGRRKRHPSLGHLDLDPSEFGR